MALARPRMTSLEFLALPEAPFRHELIDEPLVPTFDVELELDESAVLTSPLLPGFSLPVREIFEP